MAWTGPVLPALPSISYPRKRNPNWSKVDAPALSGKRTRTSLFTYPTYSYELPLNYLRTDAAFEEWQELTGFINSLQGGVGLFGYSDPLDNSITNQVFGVGDGTTTGPFQLVRSLGDFVEPIFLINGTPTIMVAGTPTTQFTIDNYGRITFNSAPAASADLSWSGSWYFPCRFDDDTVEFSQFTYNLIEVKALKFSTEKLP